MNDLQKHDWKKVRDALSDLQADTARSKPDSFSLLNALITVLASFPDSDEKFICRGGPSNDDLHPDDGTGVLIVLNKPKTKIKPLSGSPLAENQIFRSKYHLETDDEGDRNWKYIGPA